MALHEATQGRLGGIDVHPFCLLRLAVGPRGSTESLEQREIVRVLRASGIAVFAVPNGGARSGAREGALLASQGVSPGVPDLILPIPAPGRRSGLALEIKRGDGTAGDVSPSQWVWLERLHLAGWLTAVGYGAADALAKIRAYGYAIN